MEITTVLVIFLVFVVLFKVTKLINHYWNFFRKVYNLPKSKCNFFLGHIWEVLGNRNSEYKYYYVMFNVSSSNSVLKSTSCMVNFEIYYSVIKVFNLFVRKPGGLNEVRLNQVRLNEVTLNLYTHA